MPIINSKTIDININQNKKEQKNKRMSDAHIRASAKYTKKTYKNKALCIKLTDLDKIDTFLQSRNQTATQYFYECLKRDGVID